jgi:hypothetical protein
MNRVLDSETLTVSTTVVCLTASKLLKEVTSVTLYCEGTIRFWTSGKAPTSTDGIPMYDGTERELPLAEARDFKAIRKGDEDATLHIQYNHTT